MEYFEDVIGQEKPKMQLSHFIDYFRKHPVLPNFLFVAQKGDGKTMLSTLFAKHLKEVRPDKNFAPIINASLVENLDYFWEHVVLPYVAQGNFTILVDEASELPRSVMMMLLTALQPNEQHRNSVLNYGVSVEFNFARTTFIFATTDPQKLTNAFKDRLKIVSLQHYTKQNIIDIIGRRLDSKEITASSVSLDKLSDHIKHNGRAAVLLCDDIVRYCQLHSCSTFVEADCEELIKIHDLHLYGLDKNDLAVLKALRRDRFVKLMDLSSITGLERSAIQNEFETNLIRHGLMGRDTKGRYITKKGVSYLDKFQL